MAILKANSRLEIIEMTTPLLFWRKELRTDSGGPGIWRGGHGLEIEVENRSSDPVEILAAFDRIDNPPRGWSGGFDGKPGYLSLKNARRRLNGKGLQEIPAGERLIVHTPGGGGIGDPAHRASGAVAADIENGLVSRDVARADYRVTATGSPVKTR